MLLILRFTRHVGHTPKALPLQERNTGWGAHWGVALGLPPHMPLELARTGMTLGIAGGVVHHGLPPPTLRERGVTGMTGGHCARCALACPPRVPHACGRLDMLLRLVHAGLPPPCYPRA